MSNRRHDGRITRRAALRRALYGAAGLSMLGRTGLGAWAAPDGPQAVRKPAKAKQVIEFWMWGGPSHVDTFDPKPEAGPDYCGPYDKPIATNVDGIQIGQGLPKLATMADKYSIIRSMTHGINSHETATYCAQTGRRPAAGGLVYPGFGAVVSSINGRAAGYEGMIPPYVVLTRTQGRFAVEGFLGLENKPFVTGGDPRQSRFAVEGIVLQGVSDERQVSRRKLLHDLDSLGGALRGNPAFEQMDRCEDKAYDMILGDTGKVFDLSLETDAVRDRYGRTATGQSCLAARRLIEAGVPYVTVNSPGWDTHKRHFETMRQRLPELDNALSALLEDLDQRGMLDTTIVWWSGEFGRTPKIQYQAPWNGGRGHFGPCYSAVVAGGGFKGGHVIGASDERGMTPAERPVEPHDLLGSMYEQLGIDPDGPLPNGRGIETTILPPSEKGRGKGRLKEIM